ncbi:hypothetical protein [Falsirhodobacter sp. 20TX0035]|uniref:hypothetical protein n=1 Tax=Falsirhodobacter sp. 20TX0035 TaxID=3022019 RepID=UPI00232E4194|nr:hypothetical protein [Falsirhodobacter sp. 20TX0035]MDB6452561.1 hypothetical protein [Falsirhodobacter sp. 20TX0035]
MKPIRLAGASLVALCIASAAPAAVTPEDVWSNWQAVAKRWDQQVTADRTERQGDDLVVSGVKVVQDKDGNRMEGTIDRITLADQGDGTVLVTMSERFPMTVVSTPPAVEGEPAPEPITSQVVQSQENLRILASGDPSNIRNDLTADRLAVTMNDVRKADGTAVPMNVTVTMRDLDGYWEGADQMDSVTRAAEVDMMVKFSEAEQRASFDTRMQHVAITLAGAPNSAAPSVGFLGQVGFAYVTSTYRLDTAGPKTLLAEGETGAGTMNFDLGAEAMSTESDVENATLRLSGTQMPFPMDLQMAGARQTATLPVQPDQTGPFQMMLDLRDVTATDDTWARFDPKGALPRDPAQLSLSFNGTEGEAPVVTLEDLRLQAVGAELTGQGQMTPTPEAVGPMAGFGRGRIDLTLRGGNGLIDRLVAGGILPAQQEMAARMSLGAFGRAVPGQEDTVTSAIQFGNGLSVNGIPLQ